jgi:hypothetical protein
MDDVEQRIAYLISFTMLDQCLRLKVIDLQMISGTDLMSELRKAGAASREKNPMPPRIDGAKESQAPFSARNSGEPATSSDTDLAMRVLSREQPSPRSPSGSADQPRIRPPARDKRGPSTITPRYSTR